MHIQRICRRLQRGQPVMVVLRMKGFHMANRGEISVHIKPVLARPHHIFISHRPAILARHNPHPVRAQHIQLARNTAVIDTGGFQIAIPAQQQLPVKTLEQIRPALHSVWPPEQLQHRMHIKPPLAV